MCASDFRREARRVLTGKWPVAILAGLVMLLLGMYGTDGVNVNFDTESMGVHVSLQNHELVSLFSDGRIALLAGTYVAMAVVGALVLAAVLFAVKSVIRVGYAQFNLDMVDGREVQLQTLLSRAGQFKTAFVAYFLTTLYTLLWTLLLIIPGIIADYSYAMTPYILAEHPELSAREAIRSSKEMMAGNRWRLFCLQYSFIGWALLCMFIPFNLGRLALAPYREAANAVFYRSLTAPRSGATISGDPWNF